MREKMVDRITPAPGRETARLHYVSLIIPSAGEIRPTVLDKIQPIESIGSRLRDSNLRGCRGCRF